MIARSHLVAVSAPLVMLAGLAACGGGGASLSPVRSTPTATPTPASGPTTPPSMAPAAPAVTTFVLTVPSASSSNAVARRAGLGTRRPQYVSPNTGSVSVTLQSVNGAPTGASPTIVTIASRAPGCSTATGSLVCTFTATAQTGNDVYAIATYQSANGSGTVLATTAVVAAVTSADGPTIDLDLGGVPAGIAFSPTVLPFVNDGTVQRAAVTVNAVDASGSTIVGSVPYQSPIALSIVSDGAHALSLSTTSVSQPGTIVTVTYDSGKPLGAAAIVASDGPAQATLPAAPLSVAPDPVVVKDDAGTVAVQLSRPGYTGAFTASIANPNDATVNVLAGTANSGLAVANVTPSVEFDVTALTVAAGGVSTVVPFTITPDVANYTGYGSAHTLAAGAGLIAGPTGLLWGADSGTGNIFSFDPATHAYTFFPVDTADHGPTSIAFDAHGTIWFTDGSQIGKFVPATHAVTTYTTGLEPNAAITTIVADTAKTTMWFYDAGGNNALSTSNPTFVGSISTASGAINEYLTANSAGPTYYAGFPEIFMVAVPDGSIWFSDERNTALARIDTSTGAIVEYALGDSAHPQQSPTALAVGPDGRIFTPTFGILSNTSTLAAIDPASRAITYYEQNVPIGYARAATFAPDGHLWYVAQAPAGSTGLTVGNALTIASVTGAVYELGSVGFPTDSVFASIVPYGTGNFYLLDSAFGTVGKVTYK